MAALYGRLQGVRGEATRTGTKTSGIHATLETWEGRIFVDLDADGKFVVRLGEKHGTPVAILRGNVNSRVFGYVPKNLGTDVTCRYCGRIIVNDNGTWIDPEAPATPEDGDDYIWRETCDSHDTFTAEHEPMT